LHYLRLLRDNFENFCMPNISKTWLRRLPGAAALRAASGPLVDSQGKIAVSVVTLDVLVFTQAPWGRTRQLKKTVEGKSQEGVLSIFREGVLSMHCGHCGFESGGSARQPLCMF
jgi:hypothetical protein